MSKLASLGQIPVKAIELGKDAPREARPEDADVIELAASMKADGLINPILVRTLDDGSTRYELLAGSRRLAAAKLLKWKTILAHEVGEVDEEAGRRLTIVENLQRKDLPPLVEGQALKKLLGDRNGGTALMRIAAELGKTPAWVARRARLADLCEEWQAKAEKFHLPVVAMEKIARLPEDEQRALLTELSDWELAEENVCDNIEGALLKRNQLMISAPWDLSDMTLDSRPACERCWKRSMRNPELFDDFGPDSSMNDLAEKDRCLDAECWAAKKQAFVERKQDSLAEKYGDKLLKISDGYDSKPGVLSRSRYETAKKNTPGAQPACYVDGDSAGELAWVVPYGAGGCPDASGDKPRGQESQADKMALLENKRSHEVAQRLRAEFSKSTVASLESPEDVFLLVSVFGSQIITFEDGEWENFQALKNLSAEQARSDAAGMLWELMKNALPGRLLEYRGPVSQFPADEYKDTMAKLAGLIGADLNAIYDAVCLEKGFTVPKSWGLDKEGE